MKKKMKLYKFIPAFLMLLIVSQTIFAQADSLSKKKDSLNAALLNDYNKKINVIEEQRVTDSIKKAALEAELNSLKTTDNLKKEELQKQLQELSDKDARRIAQKKAQIDALRLTANGFPVFGFFNDSLFLIYNGSGSFSAKERADAISDRITKLADVQGFKPDSLQLVQTETEVDIRFNEQIIMSISESDALWLNDLQNDLAQKYKTIIGEAVVKYKAETSFSNLAKEIGLALLVIVIIIFIIRYLIRLFNWTVIQIKGQQGKRIKGIKFKNYTLFDAGKQAKVLLNINAILKWFFILLVIYIALPILFGIFPWTKNFADTLFGYILNPLKKIAGSFWDYLPKLITIIVILFVFYYVLKAIRFLKTEIEKGELKIPGFYSDWANPTYQIVKVLVFAFMIIVIFPYLPGSESPVFRGVSVFLGFLFTFGSAGSLSNIIAGLILTYMRLFAKGDRVKIGEVVGDVIEKSLLVTRVRTIKNEIISIPNSTVMNSHTVNYSSEAEDRGLIMHTTVTIGYDVPWRRMHKALIDAAGKTDLLLKEPEPFVLQTSLDDFYVSYQVNAYTKEPNKQALIYSMLHQNIQDCCNEAGIEILSPHYRAVRDGNATAIPPEYLGKDYKAPGFNVNQVKDDTDQRTNQ